MRRFLCFTLLLAWTLVCTPQVTKRYPSDLPGVVLVLSYDPAHPTADYAAETFSALPDTDPYVVTRGLDQGLVRLVNEHSRQVKRYTIPRERIRAIVRVKHDMAVLDRVDLVFTRTVLVFVHTTHSNAELFTGSDVYELPFISAHDVDRRLLARKPELLNLLDIGLAFRRENP